MKTRLTSYRSQPGDPFECVLLRPWIANNRVVIPEGAIVRGHVGRVWAVGLGLKRERARMDLVFDDFVTPSGQTFPLTAKLSSVDNAREQVTKNGVIRGVLAAGQPSQLIFGIWHMPSSAMLSRSLVGLTGVSHQVWSALSLGPVGAGGMLCLRMAFFRFPEPEIQFDPGVEMNLLLNPQLQQGLSEVPQTPKPAPEAVSKWLMGEPFGVNRRDQAPVGDIVNVAFLGSRQQLVNAFRAAGWALADPATPGTRKQAYYAYNQMRAYATAPVSPLFYKGMLPELVFQKSLNTVVKRHHIRVWYAGVVEDHELWLGAATHDIGTAFKMKSFRFTHRIDPDIDKERDKVTTDLHFAGCVEPEMRVERPTAVSSVNGRVTDGASTVLSLVDCPENDAPPLEPAPKPGNKVSRLFRRMVLESRNHVMRENPYYWTYQLVRKTRVHKQEPAGVDSGN